jgi:hypothetical protein
LTEGRSQGIGYAKNRNIVSIIGILINSRERGLIQGAGSAYLFPKPFFGEGP